MLRFLQAALFTACFAFPAMAQDKADWTTFPIPHQFPDDTRINMADVLGATAPAGAAGFVQAGDDGHLYVGDRRIRFIGVNITAASAFPSADDARITADRLAHLGVNCVRFHHMEASWVEDNITTGEKGTSRKLNPQTLDRLDRFISELKAKGIYIDMNLLVSRTFLPGDGLPAEIADVNWKRQHVIGFWYQPIIDLQKEYARNLLTHRNPYTKLTYTEDPAIAVIEVNNENGLLQGWLSNQIDDLPGVFTDDLKRQWNQWLKQHYADTDALAKAWGAKNQPLGEEILANGDFSNGLTGWTVEQHGSASVESKVQTTAYRGKPAVRLHVRKPGTAGWHVQFNQPKHSVKRGQLYTVTFAVKADKNRKIAVALGQAHDPWHALGLSSEIQLTDQWQTFRYMFIATDDDDNVRLGWSNLSQNNAVFEFADVSLKPGGKIGLATDEKLEDGTIPIVLHQGTDPISDACRTDWLQFLHDTEQRYWLTMRDYVKKELGAKALMVGTIVGCSTPNLMDAFDIIDSHAYWQHPHFPGRQWDPQNWYQQKASMVDHPLSIIPGLAGKQVKGKPFFVTEFNCGQPNPYGAEGVLLLPTYAAMQGWDGIFYFDYGTAANERINGYFDISGFPTKLANLPVAAAIFRRGDVRIARQTISVPYGIDREMDILLHTWAWGLGDAMRAGLAKESALVHRVVLTLDDAAKGKPVPTFEKPAENKFESDTGELVWDARKENEGLVTINTPHTVGLVGHVRKGQTITLGNVGFTFTGDQAWVTAVLTLTEGESLTKNPKRAILVITGDVANKGMKLRDLGGGRITCDNNWGAGPAVVKPVKGLLQIVSTTSEPMLYPLNANGQRDQAINGQPKRLGNYLFRLGSPTLWYELVWQ